MYIKYVFESAREFFEACAKPGEGWIPFNGVTRVPDTVEVVIAGNCGPHYCGECGEPQCALSLRGDGSHAYEFSDKVTPRDLIEEAFRFLSVNVVIDSGLIID